MVEEYTLLFTLYFIYYLTDIYIPKTYTFCINLE